ncbi:MAG: glycosyltransferase [Pseudonocardiaceae bacterium]
MGGQVVVDVAGGQEGGAARYRNEFERFLAIENRSDVRVVGRGRYLTADWLVRRELTARNATRKVASNNAAFMTPGGERWTVMQNALHYLTESEKREFGATVPRSVHAQAVVVRFGAKRSDVLIAPCTAMAERVITILPEVRDRVVVRFNPIAPDAFPPGNVRAPAILCPIILHPYKRMDERLAELVRALDAHGDPEIQVRITATVSELPAFLAHHPRVVALGRLPHEQLRVAWSRSRAIYFPTGIEAFGYPLGEARLSGHPVIALDTAQNREIAGGALCAFPAGDDDALRDAVARALTAEVPADPRPFDPTAYFRYLLGANRAR